MKTFIDTLLANEEIAAAVLALILAGLEAGRRFFVKLSADDVAERADAWHRQTLAASHDEREAKALEMLHHEPKLRRPVTKAGKMKAVREALARRDAARAVRRPLPNAPPPMPDVLPQVVPTDPDAKR